MKRMAANGSSRILGELEADNGKIFAVSNIVIEDMFSMLPYMKWVIGEDVSIMIKALETTGVSKMIEQCKKKIIYF